MIEQLEALIEMRGRPKAIRSDNGPKYISHEMQAWAKDQDIDGDSCNGGNPPQNAYIERFNGTFRTEVLDASVFSDLDESTHIAEQWKAMYNEERPHHALGYLPPSVFRNNCQAP